MKNLKAKIVDDLINNIYCRLRPSKIAGVGVFAIKDIPEGTDPFRVFRKSKVDYVTMSLSGLMNNKKIAPGVKELFKDMCTIEGDEIYFPDFSINEIDISYFLNHSKKPNMIAVDEGAGFRAKRKIKKGEELTVDYDTYTDE